jgi:hypothetical protein
VPEKTRPDNPEPSVNPGGLGGDESGRCEASRPNAKRITLLRAGKPKRRFVLLLAPFPEIGDSVDLGGLQYMVVAIEDAEVILRFSTAVDTASPPVPTETPDPAGPTQVQPEDKSHA